MENQNEKIVGGINREESVALESISSERVITIRCLNAVPEEVEALLAEIAQQEEALFSAK